MTKTEGRAITRRTLGRGVAGAATVGGALALAACAAGGAGDPGAKPATGAGAQKGAQGRVEFWGLNSPMLETFVKEFNERNPAARAEYVPRGGWVELCPAVEQAPVPGGRTARGAGPPELARAARGGSAPGKAGAGPVGLQALRLRHPGGRPGVVAALRLDQRRVPFDGSDARWKVFVDAFNNPSSRGKPVVIKWEEFALTITEELDAAFKNQKTPKQALDDAARRATQFVQEHGSTRLTRHLLKDK